MVRTVQFYVEGKSDQVFFEGEKFREFLQRKNLVPLVKNLRTKGNVLSNFEKFLKIQKKSVHMTILVYDKDCKEMNSKKLETILHHYPKTKAAVAIQELEAWFLADHEALTQIYNKAKKESDTQSITDPKSLLKQCFIKGKKGFKNELGFAQHFAGKINLDHARLHNKSLDRFLKMFD